MTHTKFSSPLGALYLTANSRGLSSLTFTRPRASSTTPTKKEQVILQTAKKQLTKYFAGDIQALRRIPLALAGTTFQKKVWTAMRTVKPGQTTSYRALAKKAGAAKAARAVGTACKQNPLCLVVPCHRVLRTDGSLGGYSAGLPKKRFLLKHEGCL